MMLWLIDFFLSPTQNIGLPGRFIDRLYTLQRRHLPVKNKKTKKLSDEGLNDAKILFNVSLIALNLESKHEGIPLVSI